MLMLVVYFCQIKLKKKNNSEYLIGYLDEVMTIGFDITWNKWIF